MYYEYIYIGRFVPHPEFQQYALLNKPVRVGITPVIETAITTHEFRGVVSHLIEPEPPESLEYQLKRNGIVFDEGYLTISPSRLTELGWKIAERSRDVLDLRIINSIGMFISSLSG